LNSAKSYTDAKFAVWNDTFIQYQQQVDKRFAQTDRRIDQIGAMRRTAIPPRAASRSAWARRAARARCRSATASASATAVRSRWARASAAANRRWVAVSVSTCNALVPGRRNGAGNRAVSVGGIGRQRSSSTRAFAQCAKFTGTPCAPNTAANCRWRAWNCAKPCSSRAQSDSPAALRARHAVGSSKAIRTSPSPYRASGSGGASSQASASGSSRAASSSGHNASKPLLRYCSAIIAARSCRLR